MAGQSEVNRLMDRIIALLSEGSEPQSPFEEWILRAAGKGRPFFTPRCSVEPVL